MSIGGEHLHLGRLLQRLRPAYLLAILVMCSTILYIWSVHLSKSSLLEDADNGFDPDIIYTEPKDTDWSHPNRIDEYGCLFSSCGSEDESETILTRGELDFRNYLADLSTN